MKVTRSAKRSVKLNNAVFVVLFLTLIGLLGWLSTRYSYQADWTANGRNTLAEASVEVVERLEGPLVAQAFASEASPLREHIADLLGRYQRHKRDFELRFVDPDAEPQKVRELGIYMEGEVVLEYQGRREKVEQLTEEAITNALQRLSRSGERRLLFLSGHGERSPFGQANHDLRAWGQALRAKGFELEELNLVENPVIPAATSALVIAGPQVDLLPGEVERIVEFVENGGNLLWLADTDGPRGLEELAAALGISFQPGMVVDPLTRLYGIANPTFALVSDYGLHPLTRDFAVVTLFPGAVGLEAEPPEPWRAEPFLMTTGRSWSETGELAGEITFDEGSDVAGPLTLGVALTRALEPGEEGGKAEQRVVVIGDGDFISNAYLGNGGNLDLAMNVANWLASDDQLLNIPAKTALDTSLELTQTEATVIGVVFLFVLPLLLLGSGGLVWWRRRKA